MSDSKIRISFDRFRLENLKTAETIRRCIRAVLNAEGVPVVCEINVLITDDDGIRRVNREYRQLDKPTDVLSFPMFSFTPGKLPEDWEDYLDPETGLCPLGDMAISYQRVCDQAQEYGHSIRREIGYLTIHSMLHLLGYDHMDEGEQKACMRAREEQIASGIPGLQRD